MEATKSVELFSTERRYKVTGLNVTSEDMMHRGRTRLIRVEQVTVVATDGEIIDFSARGVVLKSDGSRDARHTTGENVYGETALSAVVDYMREAGIALDGLSQR